MNRFWIATAASFLLIGCAGSPPPERTHYLLRAPSPTDLTPSSASEAAGFGRVSVAPYLEREGIVIAMGDHEIREAAFHLWAEPLAHSVRLYLRDRVATHLGRELDAGPGAENSWRFRVDVGIEQLHGTLDGRVDVVARWIVRDQVAMSTVASGRYVHSMTQSKSGYAALVAAEEQLLDGLALEIADALRAAGAPPADG